MIPVNISVSALRRWQRAAFAAWLVSASALVTAQGPDPTAAWPVGKPLQVAANNPQGQPFDVAQLRGKVSVVFVWSVSCAVCRSSLPELRANAAGWRDKPFTLLTVNVDRERDEWLAYERLVTKTQTSPKNLQPLHLTLDNSYAGKLPLTLLVDAQGHIKARIEGRMAPEAWDGVAELLL
jgi:cytochrome oxidase Cu insertion factor (SCO1/SenC/PrrC family)